MGRATMDLTLNPDSEWLERDGFHAYVSLGIIPPVVFPLSPFIIGARLEVLVYLVEPDSAHAELVRILFRNFRHVMRSRHRGMHADRYLPEFWEREAAWLDEYLATEDAPDTDDDDHTFAQCGGRPAADTLRLEITRLASPKKRRHRWEIHPYDPDPFPSAPHGHIIQPPKALAKAKLDVYTGEFYCDGQREGRESRKVLVALWNNPEFRRVAQANVTYLLQSHTHRFNINPARDPATFEP